MDEGILDEVLGHAPDDRTVEGSQRIEAGIPLDRDL
jgi:hypothetical protein